MKRIDFQIEKRLYASMNGLFENLPDTVFDPFTIVGLRDVMSLQVRLNGCFVTIINVVTR